ncbi:hypothetical protein BJX61DRAFT_548950 [Aspergillus egyptiacus]|nr:hypothetical protein BJX61DRAFT_548950 [Aspergillus egyptiacus]
MAALVTLQTQPSPTDYVALTILSLVGASYLSRGILWDQPDPYRHLLFERPQLKAGNGSAANTAQQTRNIARRLQETNASMVIFWGSQSGTAESFAHRLAREITVRFDQKTLTADLSDYDPASLAEIPASKLAIFILSTYGEGGPSDNAVEFCGWLDGLETGQQQQQQEEEKKKKKKKKLFSELKYFAFGLGNSNYKYYNRVVDQVVQALDAHGASALLPISRANDATGSTQEDFIAWKETLFTFFRETLGLPERELVYQPTLTVTPDETIEPSALYRGEPRHSSSPVPIPILEMRQLFASTSDRSCLHIDLDISSIPDLVYKTGDHLAVWPSNPDEEVNLLLQMLGRTDSAEIPLVISAMLDVDNADEVKKEMRKNKNIPSPTTLRTLLRHYLEITAQMPRDSLSTLAPFAPTAEAKTFILSLATNKDAYTAFTRRNHLTLARLLAAASSTLLSQPQPQAQPWTALPISYIIETLPQLQPRHYSISSSSVVSPRKISLTVLVHSTPLPENPSLSIPGLASTYLLSLSHCPPPHGKEKEKERERERKSTVTAHLTRTPFKLPLHPSTPLLLLATGTGLAPFRAFLHERRQLLRLGRPVGPILLFFGCRHPTEDYIYASELDDLQRGFAGRLRVVTAFSRDEDRDRDTEQEGKKKRYVQDAVWESRSTVVEMMVRERASLYVCGKAGMARGVEGVVQRALGEVLGWEGEECEEWVWGVKRRGKWLEDVWG